MTNINRVEFFRRAVSYGDGSDGDGNINNTQTFTRDRAYNNLTLNAGARMVLSGWRLFVKGTLTFNAADTDTINSNGVVGGNAVGDTEGAGAPAGAGGVFYGQSTGGPGGPGGLNAGAQANTVYTAASVGGRGGSGGAGGAGSSGIGGASRVSTDPDTVFQPKTPDIHLLRGADIMTPGSGGSGGGGGGGSGAVTGGGGGGSGSSGGTVFIAARNIVLTSCVNASIISALGGNGGNGVTRGVGNTGGGGGGGGGSGGYVFLLCDTVSGSLANAIRVSGGTGGTAGSGTGTGTAGSGGSGGSQGSYFITIHGRSVVLAAVSDKAMGAPVGAAGGAGGTLFYSL
jgi:hypothetical protein